MDSTPRLRLFAGPNGSGKSTLYQKIRKEFAIPFGYYVNADEVQQTLLQQGFFDLSNFDISTSVVQLQAFYALSDWKEKIRWEDFSFSENIIVTKRPNQLSYLSAFLADFIRYSFVEKKNTFTFESVLSHPSKLDLLRLAEHKGYRNYLYFIATDSPRLNTERVKTRAMKGGHDVPTDKVESRYYRTLELLPQLIAVTHRTYIFDNSANQIELIAEIENGQSVEIKTNTIPQWLSKALQI
ncbi:MAG: hypothetical protein RLZZ292_2153 [Bacteroidota bacterium]|jgi:predicted ABC-type ATPase